MRNPLAYQYPETDWPRGSVLINHHTSEEHLAEEHNDCWQATVVELVVVEVFVVVLVVVKGH